MPRTIYFVAASIDGYIADADGGLDWLTKGPKVKEIGDHYESFISRIGPVAMGAATYEFLLREVPVQWPYPDHPSWVFTHRALRGYAGADIRFTQADAATVHAEMVREARGKDIWLVGGGNVVAQFAQRGLLDEIWLTVIPLVLGGGIPLLPAPLRTLMELAEVTRFPRGVVELRYHVRPR